MEELDKTKLKNVLKVPLGGFRGKKIKELSPSQRFNVTQNKTKVPLGGFRGKKIKELSPSQRFNVTQNKTKSPLWGI
jgi:hypothetical protein